MSAELADYVWKDVVRRDAYIDPAAHEVIKDPDHVPLLECSVNLSPFTKPSEIHGRNMEDPEGLVFKNQPLTDENGDVYTTFTIKGADASLPTVSYFDIEPSGIRVNGLMDDSTMYRSIEASELLRGAGVLTEWPIFVANPKTFPDGEGDIGLLEFKYMLYDNYITTEKIRRANNERHYLIDGVGKAGLVGSALLDMHFGVMYRAMLSNVRVSELNVLEAEPREQAIRAAIASLQARRPEHFTCWPDLQLLNPESEADQRRYITKILPALMGENLARFHNTGSYHNYLHPGNWTIAGEIVDLDSVHSTSLSPEEAVETVLK